MPSELARGAQVVSIRDTQRARVIAAIGAHLLATGLAETSLRQLAAAAGVSDRMLLYYFTDKADLLAQAMAQIAADSAAVLADAIPAGAALSAGQLIGEAVRVTSAPAMKPFMRLWIEVVAAAARGEAPFPGIAHQITQGFLSWIEARLGATPEAERAAAAAMILAVVDGMALVEVCSGAALTAQAADYAARLRIP
jgi:AcrR family transcriptional regulator